MPNSSTAVAATNSTAVEAVKRIYTGNEISGQLQQKPSDNNFFDVLNAEISDLIADADAASNSDTDVLKSLDLTETMHDIELPENLDLESFLADFSSSLEALKQQIKDWPQDVQNAMLDALDSLPESLSQLPFTTENMQFLQQQAVIAMAQKDEELAKKAQQLIGLTLPIEGNNLPVQVKLSNEKSVDLKVKQAKTAEAPVVLHKIPVTEQQDAHKLKSDSLVSQTLDNDRTHSLNKAEGLEYKESQTQHKQDKQLFEQIIAKTNTESASQHRSAEHVVTQSLSHLTTVSQTSGASSASTVAATSSMQLPLHSTPAQWGLALGDKVQWMINSKLETAEIRIDPPHLGKMDVKIKMDGDNANVVIHTHQAATRDLVDAASFRLKEMLQDSGYNTVNVDVSHQEQGQTSNEFAQSESSSSENNAWSQNSNEIDEPEMVGNSIVSGTIGASVQVLDIFA